MNQETTSLTSADCGADASGPSWQECDVFCIHSWSGESGPPCGWRGRLHEARLDETRRARICPRCGRPSVLLIPRDPEI